MQVLLLMSAELRVKAPPSLELPLAVLMPSRLLQHMALDSMTGLDPEGVALRATEGLFGVDYFFPVRAPTPPHRALPVSWCL